MARARRPVDALYFGNRVQPRSGWNLCARVGTLAVKPLVAVFLVVIPLTHLRKGRDAKCNGNCKNATTRVLPKSAHSEKSL